MTSLPRFPLSMSHPRGSRGLTLIEMLVAMAISFIVILAVGYVFIGSRQTYRAQDAMARVQEGARFAYEALSKDIRQVGFAGCTTATTQNVLNLAGNNDSDWYKNLFGAAAPGVQPLFGYQDVAPADVCTTANTPPCYIQGDPVTIIRADNANEYIISAHASPQFTLTANHDINAGAILVVTNCSDTAVFQATGVGANTINHNAAGNPGNSTDVLNGAYGAGARIYRLSAVTYYVGTNPVGEPALYRRRLTQAGGIASTTAEELVEGVEDMQLTYGVDTDGAADRQVNEYQTADEITNGACSGAASSTCTTAVPGANAAARWRRVLSMRMSLLMRTENGVTNQAQTYTFPPGAAATTTAADRRLRRVFTYVIAVRNRL